jgi:predicted amidophosphoribosyltransferase
VCRAPEPASPPAVHESSGAPVECPMCGLAFTTGGAVCAGCPLHAACDLVRCPRCAYTFPRTSRTVELLRSLFRRLFGQRAGKNAGES